MLYEDYARTWRLVKPTGDYCSSRENYQTCHCCGKGRMAHKPLLKCIVYHVFLQNELKVWLCFVCFQKCFRVPKETTEEYKREHRAWHNERAFEHLLTPLRGELSAHIESVPFLKTFMECIQNREVVPLRILTFTNHYVTDHT